MPDHIRRTLLMGPGRERAVDGRHIPSRARSCPAAHGRSRRPEALLLRVGALPASALPEPVPMNTYGILPEAACALRLSMRFARLESPGGGGHRPEAGVQ